MTVEFSVVIPVYNEEENIQPLLQEIIAAAEGLPLKEIVCTDDCSSDSSVAKIAAFKKQDSRVRVIRHMRRSGQSAAVLNGVRAAKAPAVITMDGDGQNDPADIRKLYEAYVAASTDGGAVLVAGQRARRQDNLRKKLASRFANGIRRAWLKDGTRDTGCGLKMFTRTAFLALPPFNHMHRYLPALFSRAGARVVHVDVGHRPRSRGVSKYGVFDRAWAGISDLIGVKWLLVRMITVEPGKEEMP